MSSWSSGRVHFRERKIPNRTIVPEVSQPIQESVQSIPLTNDYPSKYFMSKTSTNDAIICCIALNEESYIDEWIKYHLTLGFNHIYIYDNSTNNSLKDKRNDKVTVIHFPGKERQLDAYNLCIVQNRRKHNWCAFIDCDEFIVLKKHSNINDFLKDYDSYESIGLNWKMFGTSNETRYANEPVTSRFKYCNKNIDNHIKSISKLAYTGTYISPHYSVLLKGNNYDTHGHIITGPFNDNGSDDIACIHHYYTKSEEEFRRKIERGKADINEKRSLDELIEIHSKNNDIYNSDAWDFYSKHL